MKCPFCIDKNKETSVLDSRPSENGSVIRRRRICIDCKSRFTTHERIQFREIVVVKKDGDKVNFDRDKISQPPESAKLALVYVVKPRSPSTATPSQGR